jgi:hypothetical protein
LPVRVVTGEKDLVVKEVSAKGTYGSIDWHPVNHGHGDIVKPSEATDERYQKAREFLVQCRPAISHFALCRLRELSDGMLALRFERLCSDWKYYVHIHGGASYAPDDRLLASGFSPFVVKKCSYNARLDGPNPCFGFAWGPIASDRVWKKNPAYVHRILLQDVLPDELRHLSGTIDEVLAQAGIEASWNTLIPSLNMAISCDNRRFPLTPSEIERDVNVLVRTFSLPGDLRDRVGEEVTFEIDFNSYAPRGTKSFTLQFPWLHVGFEGVLTVYENCSRISVNQFLASAPELRLMKPEHTANKCQLSLETKDIVLPHGRVEIMWEAEDTRTDASSGKPPG